MNELWELSDSVSVNHTTTDYLRCSLFCDSLDLNQNTVNSQRHNT